MVSDTIKEFNFLKGTHIEVRRTTRDIAPELYRVLYQPTGWYADQKIIKNESQFVDWLSPSRPVGSGSKLSFAARDLKTNEWAGISTLFFPQEPIFKAEIGFTWIAEKFKRTYVNTEL